MAARFSTSGTSWSMGVKSVPLALAIGALVIFLIPERASADSVSAPALSERNDTVQLLARAAKSQHICYGWSLSDGSRNVVSVGSNLGDGVAVDSSPQSCPRWIELTAMVTYTAESSEAEDWSSVSVNSSPGLESYGMAAGLDRFGLDSGAFVDDPGWAVCRAATVLPLLAAEAGLADPAATPTAGPTAEVTPLADAGSDMWRDRWGYFAGAVGLLLGAVLLVVLGFAQRRTTHNRQAETQRRLAARRRRQQRTAKDWAPERTREKG